MTTATTMRAAIAAAILLALAWPSVSHSQSSRRTFILTNNGIDTTAVGMADSTGTIGVSGFQRMVLTLQPSRPCRVAIQIRKHGLADTTSGTVALRDTTNAVAWPWCKTAGADSMLAGTAPSYRQTTFPTSVTGGSDEFVVEFTAAGVSKWGGPRGEYIEIKDLCNGAYFTARRMSVRLRVLSASGVVTWTQASVDAFSW